MSNRGRRWFEQRKRFVGKAKDAPNGKADAGPDLWMRCPGCHEMLYLEALVENLQVCHLCDHHMGLEPIRRLTALCDEGSLALHDAGLAPVDALGFVDSKPYPQRIAQSRAKTGQNDAFVAATACLWGVELEIGCFDFRFMGGSMGSVVGEAIARLFERASHRQVPAVVISASGGARMQEGVLSLMQMAKTCAALGKLRDVGQPYVSVLTHPTTGGVAASFSMLGDLILAEPHALIGFAGPRVIKETIGEELPEGFQTAEYLLEHGLIDQIVSRDQLRPVLGRVLRQLLRLPACTLPRALAQVTPAGVGRVGEAASEGVS